MKILALALTLVLGLIPAFATPAFAVTSVFQIDVADSDPNKNYNVCVVTQGYEALPTDCMNFKGSDFGAYYAEFYFEDLLIGDPFYVSVEDLSTNQFVYKYFNNTKTNPQLIGVSLSEMGPKQQQATQYDVETDEQVEPEGTTTTWTNPNTGLKYDIPMGEYCLDFNGDSICDVDFKDGKQIVYEDTQVEDEAVEPEASGNGNDNDNDANPYCDKFDEVGDWPDSGCHDRKDYHDGGPNDGLYPCNDGSNKKDWRNCPDVSGYDYDDSNNDDSNNDDSEDTGGSDPEGEEEDQSCGGEPCTDDEKEDSWTEEEEYEEEDEYVEYEEEASQQ